MAMTLVKQEPDLSHLISYYYKVVVSANPGCDLTVV
jgi:hypothetical protein